VKVKNKLIKAKISAVFSNSRNNNSRNKRMKRCYDISIMDRKNNDGLEHRLETVQR
jgi:hypothetical protein